MNKINIVIYDYDLEYIESLIELFNKKYYKYVKLSGITNLNELNRIIESAQKIDILLVNSSLEFDISKFRFIKMIIEITERETINDIERKVIYKYQSGHAIYSAIKKIYKAENKNTIFDDYEDSAKVISVYSPIGGSGKTILSVSLVNKLCKQGKKVLYINLEDIASMDVFFDTSNNAKNLSDLFYIEDEVLEENISILNEVINKDNRGVFYINPVNSVLDLEEVSGKSVINIIYEIKKHNNFDYIVLDLGSKFSNVYNMVLEVSDKIFLLLDQTNIGIGKIDTFLRQIDNGERLDLVVNKYELNKGNINSGEIIKLKKPLYHRIPLDLEIANNNLNIESLTGSGIFSISVNELTNKLLREGR